MPTSIQVEALSFSQLFGLGTFVVPWHQRHYDWEKVHVTALLTDIEEASREGSVCYFLGSIMLIESDGVRWQINDGQQRMITISLIIARLCRMASDENADSQRVRTALEKLFVLPPDQVCSLDEADDYRPRIEPPRNDRSLYHQLIRGNSIGTNGKLTIAWKEIDKFVASKAPEDAYRYFDYLVQKTEVAVLRVPKAVDANAVYETLNFRGKRLDHVDLIRNHLYSFFSEDSEEPRRDTVHDNLERIGDALTRRGKSRNRSAEEYMRCHAQCLFGFLRGQHFYHDFRHALRGHLEGERRLGNEKNETVFRLVGTISNPVSLELYRLISSPVPDPDTVAAFESITKTNRKPRRLSVFLRELRNYTVVQPLLFSMLAVYGSEYDGRKRRRIANEINRCFGRLATFVLRTAFVAPKFEPSHYESKFAGFARKTTGEQRIPEQEFSDFLRNCDSLGILDDGRFRELMRGAKMTGAPRIRSFVLGINTTATGDYTSLHPDRCTVEHILPQGSPHWDGWDGFAAVNPKEYVHRIGNLTLLGPEDNKDTKGFNGNFEAKRPIFAQSAVAVTRRIAKWKKWSPGVIEKREADMIERAVRVWTFED